MVLKKNVETSTIFITYSLFVSVDKVNWTAYSRDILNTMHDKIEWGYGSNTNL